jgi:hypothetical protein
MMPAPATVIKNAREQPNSLAGLLRSGRTTAPVGGGARAETHRRPRDRNLRSLTAHAAGVQRAVAAGVSLKESLDHHAGLSPRGSGARDRHRIGAA